MISLDGIRVLGRVAAVYRKTEGQFLPRAYAVDTAPSHLDITGADLVTLMPCLDFFAPLRPVVVGKNAQGEPITGFSRDPVCTTRDFALKPYPVHLRIGPGAVFDFIDEMAPTDQKTYMNFIAAAMRSADAHAAQQSGLHLPTAQDLAAIGGGRG